MEDYQKLIELKNAIEELLEIPANYADSKNFNDKIHQARANVREILSELPLILP